MAHDTIVQFERMIYLPMLLTILELDAKSLKSAAVKFTSPYQSVIKMAVNSVHRDLTATHLYFKENRLRLVNDGNDGMFTSYIMFDGNNQYRRKYMNYRLRNRSEELLGLYLMGQSVNDIPPETKELTHWE